MDPQSELEYGIALQLIGEAAVRERLLKMKLSALSTTPEPSPEGAEAPPEA